MYSSHLNVGKRVYKEAGVFKQRLVKTKESRSRNCPKDRFTMPVNPSHRGTYKFDRHKWKIVSKPKEWVRFNRQTVNALKILTNEKYW